MKRRRFHLPLAALTAMLLLSQSGPAAQAAPHPGEIVAREHFKLGEDLYGREQYAYALIEFEAGYAALPLPGFLINIGQCRRRLGDVIEARASYERFLQQAPDSPLAPAVRNLIQELGLTPPPLDTTQVAPPPAPVKVVEDRPLPVHPRVAESRVPALGATPRPIVPVAVDAALRDPVDASLSGPAPATKSRRLWWIVGALAIATVTVSALVIGSGGDTTTTIHDGTLGTLRR
jgi:hypothetical protein